MPERPPRLGRRLLTLVLAASLVGACGGDDEPSAATTTTSTSTTSTSAPDEPTTTTTAPQQGVRVTVLDAGAEPRQQLRYRVQPGTTDAVTQTNQMSLVQEVGGQTQELTTPATEIDVDYVAEDVGDDGFTAVGTFAATRVSGGDPAAAAETERLLAQLAGARIATVVTDRGEILESRLDGVGATGNPVFDQLASSLVEQARNLSFPFPDEAVGVGARWAVESDVEIGGLPIEARYVVTLTAVEGDVVRGDIDASLRFVPGPVVVQGAPAEVISGESAGTGQISWQLSSGLVPRIQMDMIGSATMEVAGTRLVQQQAQRSGVIARS